MPVSLAASVPDGLVKPYAELLLEERTGSIGIIPSEAFAEKTPPSDADVQAFYAKNSRRYMVPERRVVRYAPITYDALGAAVAPTGAEIQRFYTANKAGYGPSETRRQSEIIRTEERRGGKECVSPWRYRW